MARTDTPKRPTAPEPVDPEPVDPEPAGSQSDDPADEDTSPQPQVELDQSVINGFEGINEEIVVDTSEGRHVYLIGTDDEYIRLAPSAYRLLKKRLAGYSFSEIAERLREHDVAATPQDVCNAYEHVVKRIGDIHRNRKSRLERSGFFFQRTVFSRDIVHRIAQHFTGAFHPVATALLVGATAVVFWIHWDSSMVGDALATSSFWAGYGIFLGTLLIHEFGHASAACRYGSRPHDIGITVYLIYPAFYSNVSSVWRLRRWQRVVVDLAGTYFQFVAAAALLVGYAWTEWPPLRIAILLTIGTTIFSLNPVLKFDGYWLVADALGVTNLSKQPRRVLSAFWARLRDREAPPLPWSSTIVGILALYTVASIAIWSYFLVMIGQLFWGQLLSYPGMVSQFVSDGVDPSVTLDSARYHELFVSTYLSFIVVYLPGRLIWGFLPKLRDYAERLGEQIPFIASAPEPET